MIVAGMYDRRCELSLLLAYKICVCEWRGAPCTQSSFIVMAPGPRHTAGPTETPPPPYTGRAGGGGTRKRERTRSARSRDLLRHRAALSCDHIQRRGGGDPLRHRSCDTSLIGGGMHSLGLLLPYAGEGT